MTQLSDKEHNVQMEDMKSFDEQMPCVGIFWYDPEDNTLFGVRKKEITPKMVEESRTQGVDVIIINPNPMMTNIMLVKITCDVVK